MAVPAYDILDTMAYAIAASGILLGVTFFRLPYSPSTDSFGDEKKNLRRGLGLALGLAGFYLAASGLRIGYGWVFSSGYANILFGGVAALGGLVLIGVSAALFMNGGLQALSYFAAVVGAYLFVDAYAISSYGLAGGSMQSILIYLGPGIAAVFTIPATHIDNKLVRWVFAAGSIAFGIGWLYFGLNTAFSHMRP